MIEKYTLDNLTQESVSVKKQSYMEYMGQEYPIGQPWRRAYLNSARGREQIIAELPQAQVNAIIAVWGDTPTVIEKESI
ncbi:hypothetical protein MKY04_16175 [Lysinibacillus telephonicus]|uniref:hypothetical protein n=1 Tax=Lysinibacillus telephonicus TaxID=1714840 RepID=UPI0031FD8F26